MHYYYIDYHELSFTLNKLKFVMTVNDSFLPFDNSHGSSLSELTKITIYQAIWPRLNILIGRLLLPHPYFYLTLLIKNNWITKDFYAN